jgi:glycerophosphoryl diester phosphodiesterase
VTQVIGHRGASRAERENTLAAFHAAAAQGADGVELDVRRTADGALAVLHDAHLPDGRAIVATTWADMPEDVPDLAAALDACSGLGTVNVEIKNWPDDIDFDPSLAVVDAVVDVLLARPATERAAVLVSCFHLPTVDRVRERAPELATGWLVIAPGIGALGTPIDTGGSDALAATATAVADRGHRALHPYHAFVNRELVDAAHAAGVAVNTWTADDPERIVWLAETGVDAVITNVPDVALAALGRAS